MVVEVVLIDDAVIVVVEDLEQLRLTRFALFSELAECNEVLPIRAVVSLERRRHRSEIHRCNTGSNSATQAYDLVIKRDELHSDVLCAPETTNQAFSVSPRHES